MSKISFSKLNLKKIDEVKSIKINDVDIEVKQYLPINEKLDLISRVISGAHDENNFSNPIKLDVLSTIEIIMAYTNLTFTDKQKEDVAKLYDLLAENGIADQVMAAIPCAELEKLQDGLGRTVKSIYEYQNSALGILESISQDYSNLNLDAEKLQKTISDPENLKLLKDVLTKLG